jgi:membrane fusion protein
VNAQSQHPLFRPEVAAARRIRIEGEVVLVQPVRTTMLVLLLFGGIALIALWVATGSYARTETARGILVTEQPSAKIVAIRPGQVTELLVREGAHVGAGQRLAVVRVEQANESGGSSVVDSLGAIEAQRRLSERQLQLTDERAASERARLSAVLSGIEQHRGDLSRQIEIQREVVVSAQQMFERIESIVQKGFVSRTELERRRQAWLAARQQLAQLQQQHNALASERQRAEAEFARVAAESGSEVNAALSSAETLAQQRARLQGERAYVLTAPISGRIAALQTATGRTVDGSVPLMEIVPEGSALQAQIYAPTRAIGFLRPGQEVRLLYDAFPYQRFGSFSGHIVGISRAVIDPRELAAPLKLEEPVYRIAVAPDGGAVGAFGSEMPLQPGMTLTANVILERRSFLDWLLAPLRAVVRRSQ